MEEPETIEPETPKDKEIKEEYEIKIDDNKIRIEMNNNEIIFCLIIDLSFNKYIKRYKHDIFRKEFKISEIKNLKEMYDEIINYDYDINIKRKKLFINNKSKDIFRIIELEEEIRLTNEEMIKELIIEIKTIKKEKNRLENQVYELDNIVNKNKYKNEIKLIYNTEKEEDCRIFGDKFVKNNINNIELNINGNKSKLVSTYELKKGDNNVKMIIKNKIKDLSHMFKYCKKLKNIDELKYLNIKYYTDFSFMFCGCKSLNNIKSLENWDVSNGTNFEYIFYGCKSLNDIKPLEKWNVSNGTNFWN